jgi:hypothetical protein
MFSKKGPPFSPRSWRKNVGICSPICVGICGKCPARDKDSPSTDQSTFGGQIVGTEGTAGEILAEALLYFLGSDLEGDEFFGL